jgi:hypothetical protein
MNDDHLGDEHGGAGVVFGLMSILLVSVIGVIVFAVTLSPGPSKGANGSTAGLPFVGSIPTVPGSSAEASGLGGIPSASYVAACEADGKSVEVAVVAYQASRGAYPVPPSAWSAATYEADYAPLTGGSSQNQFLPSAPPTTHYVVEFDSAGHVWVEPPGQYDAGYDAAHSIDVTTTCADVAK